MQLEGNCGCNILYVTYKPIRCSNNVWLATREPQNSIATIKKQKLRFSFFIIITLHYLCSGNRKAKYLADMPL